MDDLLTTAMAFVLAALILGVPALALSLRFALKPLVEAWARLKEAQHADPQELALFRREMELLDQRLESVESQLVRIGDAAEFHRQLEGPEED